MNNIQKAAVIGCGFVGSSIAFTLMQSGIFSELVLIDANRDKAEGEAMDLSHGLPFTHPMDIRAGDYDDVADCALVIVTAGAGQKPGETRLDLVHKNVAIFRSIIPEIARRNRDAILLIVSNPVDVLTWAAWKLSGYPANRVLGSGTVLDTARLKYLLRERLGVDSRSVHAFIIGEHGDTELPVWSSANVSGIDLADFCKVCGKCADMAGLHGIYEEVKNSAYRIIERKGATNYAIAKAVRRIAEAVGSLEIKKTERRTDESVEVWRIVRRFRRRIVTGEEGGRSMYGGRDRRRIGFGRHNRPAFADGPDGRCGR